MVIVLISIVSAVAVPQFLDFRDDAKSAVTKERLMSLRNAIVGDSRNSRLGYFHHLGSYPASLNDLATQGSKPAYDPIGKIGWNGPYVDTSVSGWNLDAWGTAIQYSANARTLTSCGPNSTCGNADDIVLSF